MSRKTISNKQVKEIRQNGIVYLDYGGNEQIIDFEQCYQNYLSRRLSPEGIESYKELNHKTDDDVKDYIDRVSAWKEIAYRNVLGDDVAVDGVITYSLPYFEFHTQPPVRIEFESRGELSEMRHKLEHEFHWRTFDLT